MTACLADWPAFGLADPGHGLPCSLPAGFNVSQGCVHEHVAASDACYACVAEMLSCGGDPDQWDCGPCSALGHSCPAPLVITELAAPVPEGSRP